MNIFQGNYFFIHEWLLGLSRSETVFHRLITMSRGQFGPDPLSGGIFMSGAGGREAALTPVAGWVGEAFLGCGDRARGCYGPVLPWQRSERFLPPSFFTFSHFREQLQLI